MRTLLICLGLMAITLAVYWPVRDLQFVNYDDEGYVYENPYTTQGLTASNFFYAFRRFDQANYHPLTWISLSLDVSLFGLNPRGFHVENACLHALSSALLFLFLMRATKQCGPSLFVAMIFSLHPVHVESVAWVAERKDVLCGLFFMLTLLAYLGYARAVTRRASIFFYLITFVCLGLGLLSKQMIVTMPFVLLLFDVWPLHRARVQKWCALIVDKIPLLLLSIAASIATFHAQHAGGAMMDFEKLPLSARVTNAIVAYFRYLGKIFYPIDLAVFYPHPMHWSGGLVAASVAMLVLLTVSFLLVFKRFPFLLIGWLFFLGSLVPVIGLVQIGWQSIADRYLYLPIIGPAIMVGWAGEHWLANRSFLRVARVVIAGSIATLCAVLSVRQIQFWKDTRTLFTHDLQVTGENAIAHVQLGYLDTRLGDWGAARMHYEEAIRVDPTYFVSQFNLANLLVHQGQPDLALVHYEKAAYYQPHMARIENNWGIALLHLNQPREAFEHFQRAVQIDPQLPEAHLNLGQLYMAAGRSDSAAEEFRTVLRLDPQNTQAIKSLQQIGSGHV